MWATYPAETLKHGSIVSDRLFSFQYAEATPPPGVASPSSNGEAALAARRTIDEGFSFERMHRYIPQLTESEFSATTKQSNPWSTKEGALRRIVIETDVYDSLANSQLQRSFPDLTLLYIQGTDAIGHLFASEGAFVSPNAATRYSGVVQQYFREIDALIARYQQLAQKSDAVLMLVSDHGFRWDDPTPLRGEFSPQTAAHQHAANGIYLLWDPRHLLAPQPSKSAQLRQITPTLLALAGLPQDDDAASPIDSPLVPKAGGKRSYSRFVRANATAVNAAPAASEEIAKLKALGYLGSSEASTNASTSTRTAGSFNNEGVVYEHEGDRASAIKAYEEAIRMEPRFASAEWNLSRLLEGADARRADALLVSAVKDGYPGGAAQIISRARQLAVSDAARALALLDAATRESSDPDLHLLRGKLQLQIGKCAEAARSFDRAVALRRDALTLASRGLARACLGDRRAAESDLRASLALDPNQPEVNRFLQHP
jgi:Flp pilus assembly protein TadD